MSLELQPGGAEKKAPLGAIQDMQDKKERVMNVCLETQWGLHRGSHNSKRESVNLEKK